MQPLRFVLAAAAWALIATAPARADAPDAAALQEEIQALKATVRELQSRVSQLEARAAGSSQPATTSPVAPQAAAANSQAAPVAATGAATGAAVVTPAHTEAPSPVVPAGSAYESPEATLRMNWSKVARGMDQDEVMGLLGAPSMKTTLDGRTVWYYAYPGTGRGSVFFTDAGKVSSRQSPFGWGW